MAGYNCPQRVSVARWDVLAVHLKGQDDISTPADSLFYRDRRLHVLVSSELAMGDAVIF